MNALLVCLALFAATPSSNDVAAELKRMTNELLAAVAPGDTKPWKKYTDDRFIYSTEANEVMTKEQLLKDFAPLPKGLAGQLQVGVERGRLVRSGRASRPLAKDVAGRDGQRLRAGRPRSESRDNRARGASSSATRRARSPASSIVARGTTSDGQK